MNDVTPTFHQLGLPPKLVEILSRRGVRTPFPIQTQVIPDALAGRDVLGRGRTGSGKTLAFGLPLLARLAADPERPRKRRPRALVLVPTRELAQQVHDALAPLGQTLGLRSLAIYGGAPMGRQIDSLGRGVDLVVATPGRLTDHLERGSANLEDTSIVVLDEADHLCDLGFLPAVRAILNRIPAGQRMLFSATLDGGVNVLVKSYLRDPVTHSADGDATPVPEADHKFVSVGSPGAKLATAASLLAGRERSLVFVRTRRGADRLAMDLSRAGLSADAIHGERPQHARTRALAGFANGSTAVLVATDVAARGIHVDGVDLVLQFDPPEEHKAYLHRAGRTARAGATGNVVTLVLPAQEHSVATMRRRAGVGAGLPAVAARSGRPPRQHGRPTSSGHRHRPAGRTGGSGRPNRAASRA